MRSYTFAAGSTVLTSKDAPGTIGTGMKKPASVLKWTTTVFDFGLVLVLNACSARNELSPARSGTRFEKALVVVVAVIATESITVPLRRMRTTLPTSRESAV